MWTESLSGLVVYNYWMKYLFLICLCLSGCAFLFENVKTDVSPLSITPQCYTGTDRCWVKYGHGYELHFPRSTPYPPSDEYRKKNNNEIKVVKKGQIGQSKNRPIITLFYDSGLRFVYGIPKTEDELIAESQAVAKLFNGNVIEIYSYDVAYYNTMFHANIYLIE